jgi:hypothetical protein
MKQKMTAKQIIISWLRPKANRIITYYKMEEALPNFGEKKGVLHTASYYCRQFRLLKENNQLELNKHGISLKEITGSKFAMWKINLLNQ